ncbi:MAG: S41 family peptidase [Ekhidna sp.]
MSRSKKYLMKTLTLFFLSIFSFCGSAQNEIEYLTKSQVADDLAELDAILQLESSYQGLNGYHYQKDLDDFLANIPKSGISLFDFELFLTKVIGKIGDRHAYVKGERLRNTLFLPFAFAPHEGKVLVMEYERTAKEYRFFNREFPYLQSVNGIPIDSLLSLILPGDILAPKKSYAIRAIRELRDIETIFKKLNTDLPNPIPLTLSNEEGKQQNILVELVTREGRTRYWDERIYRKTYLIQEKDYNDSTIIERFFQLKNNIAYIELVDMVDKEESPLFFEYLNSFMVEAKQSEALIIDVRDNGGGTRHLIHELAGYIVHPDSVYVVNVAKQRSEESLNEEQKEDLHDRYLYSRDEKDEKEQRAIDQFMISFKPTYDLSDEKFSEYHYYLLNGQKLTNNKYHFNKPVYILANERSFSAASILVSVLKGLPNITIAGVTTDGSSGNSQRFELSNSGLRGKISTMVSFQKDGQLLDGIGTKPDIIIERSLDQIFWKEDFQLNTVFQLIKEKQ